MIFRRLGHVFLIIMICLSFHHQLIAIDEMEKAPVSSQWNMLFPGGPIYEIFIDGNDIYIGGNFIDALGDPDADYVARWDGCQWHALGAGLNGVVRTIVRVGSDIYVGGEFTLPYNYIARWDGVQWNAVGVGPGNPVNSIAFNGVMIVAGGGTWSSGFVSQWNGSSWSTIGSEMNGLVNKIVINASSLYAGGRFTDVGGNPNADGVIKWEDGAWNNLGAGFEPGNGFGVWDMLLYDGELYVGGIIANKVARWDGEEWDEIGSGLPGFLGFHAIAICNDTLYATVGAGWSDDDGIYRMDPVTETWEIFQVIGLGADDPLLCLISSGSNMYVGAFSGMSIGGQDFGGVAYWGEPSYPGIVTSTDDIGAGSLREKIHCAADGDTITFTIPPLSQIILTSGEIVIDKDLTLTGPGIDDLVISGNHSSRIFNLLPGINFLLENLTLSNASALNNGGAVYTKGNLTLKNALLRDNFENGMRKAITLISPGMLTVEEVVEIKE